jgi:hypothetical protein
MKMTIALLVLFWAIPAQAQKAPIPPHGETMAFLRQEHGVYIFKTGGGEVRATCVYTQLAYKGDPNDVMAALKATPERQATCAPQNLKKETFLLRPKDLTKCVAGWTYFEFHHAEDGTIRMVLDQMGNRVVHLPTGTAPYPDYDIEFKVLSK